MISGSWYSTKRDSHWVKRESSRGSWLWKMSILAPMRMKTSPGFKMSPLMRSVGEGPPAARPRRRAWRRARAQGRGRSLTVKWVKGEPLQELYTSDADVPAELRALIAQVVANHQARAQPAQVPVSSIPNPVSNNTDGDIYYDAVMEGIPLLKAAMQPFIAVQWEPFKSRVKYLASLNISPSVLVPFCPTQLRMMLFVPIGTSMIEEEKNNHAMKISSAAFRSGWYPTNIHELLCLFSFWMMEDRQNGNHI